MMDDEDLQRVYQWVDEIPLSRPKRNIARDFADGVLVAHVPNGPATEGAIVGFIKLAPGTSFPTHTHLGDETVLVVQGAFRDSEGEEARAGDTAHRSPRHRSPVITHQCHRRVWGELGVSSRTRSHDRTRRAVTGENMRENIR